MRSFRFGLVDRGDGDVRDTARMAEDRGYSIMLFADHLGLHDPFVAATTAASATDHLRVGTLVVNNGLRPVGILAQLAATVDLVSDGRFELGIGAGYAAGEHRSIGLPFAPAGERLDRLEQTLPALRQLFAGKEVSAGGHLQFQQYELRPLPAQGAGLPLLVGGNGDRVLRLGAAYADIIGFTGFSVRDDSGQSLSHVGFSGLADRVAHVRGAAGNRFEGIELNLLVQQVVVTDDPESAAAELSMVKGGQMSADQALASPFLLIGSVASITERLVELRERFGVTYIAVFEHRSDRRFDQVVSQLA